MGGYVADKAIHRIVYVLEHLSSRSHRSHLSLQHLLRPSGEALYYSGFCYIFGIDSAAAASLLRQDRDVTEQEILLMWGSMPTMPIMTIILSKAGFAEFQYL